MRVSIMTALDDFNNALSSYQRFFEVRVPLVEPGRGGRPARVLDLAAGHGGFPLAGARLAAERGLDIRFTASDIKQEYLEIGGREAARGGVDVDFVIQDALDLSNIAPGTYDIIVCTQSLHHFPPGLVAVMFEQATRVAGRGVLFIDGCRSALASLGVALFGAIGYRSLPFIHDGVISLRKSYVPEELELLARMGSWGDGSVATWMAPGYCLLCWTRPEAGAVSVAAAAAPIARPPG